MNPNGFFWQAPPFHQLMKYVFAEYSTLDPPCEQVCDDCHPEGVLRHRFTAGAKKLVSGSRDLL